MLKWGSLHPFKGGGGVKSVTLSGGGGGVESAKGLVINDRSLIETYRPLSVPCDQFLTPNLQGSWVSEV